MFKMNFFLPKTVERTEDKIMWHNLSLWKVCHWQRRLFNDSDRKASAGIGQTFCLHGKGRKNRLILKMTCAYRSTVFFIYFMLPFFSTHASWLLQCCCVSDTVRYLFIYLSILVLWNFLINIHKISRFLLLLELVPPPANLAS